MSYVATSTKKQIISKAIDQWAVVFTATGLLFKTRKVAPAGHEKERRLEAHLQWLHFLVPYDTSVFYTLNFKQAVKQPVLYLCNLCIDPINFFTPVILKLNQY